MDKENKTNNEQSAEVAEESKADKQNIKSDEDLQNDFDELKKLSDPSFAKASEGEGGINDNNQDKESLKKELAETKAREAEYLNGWKRAKADYINLQKEKEKERKEIVEFANAALIAELLPVYSNLKKAVAHIDTLINTNNTNVSTNIKNWAEGVKLIKRQWSDIFKVVGIEEIKTVGEKFNPEFHEAVKKSEEPKEEGKEDIIVEEVEPGYMFKGKVIYPAKVAIS